MVTMAKIKPKVMVPEVILMDLMLVKRLKADPQPHLPVQVMRFVVTLMVSGAVNGEWGASMHMYAMHLAVAGNMQGLTTLIPHNDQ